MMISPQLYVDEFKHDTFEKLFNERERLYKEIKETEKDVFDPDRKSNAWHLCPGPDVQYRMKLEYLSELCRFIAEKYRIEVVWGESMEE